MKKIRIPIPSIRWLSVSWSDEVADRNGAGEPSYDARTTYAAQYRYQERKRQERVPLGLQVNTGKPLKKKSWKYRTDPAPERYRKQDRGEAHWQQTPFYLKYGESQSAMAKRYGVSKEAIRLAYNLGQCPRERFSTAERIRRRSGVQVTRGVSKGSKTKNRILRLCERAGYDRPFSLLTENRSQQQLNEVIWRHGLNKIGAKSVRLMQRYQRRFCGAGQLQLL